MAIELLEASHAKAYRQLMLEAYALHPEAFVSNLSDRERLPLSWWQGQLDDELSAMLGAFVGDRLVGIDRKSTRLNSSHGAKSRMPSSA